MRRTLRRLATTGALLTIGTGLLPLAPAPPAGASAASWSTISIGGVTVREGDTGKPRTASFPVTLSQAPTETLTVDYRIMTNESLPVASRATPGVDFNDKGGKTLHLTFKAGQRIKYIQTTVYPDQVPENSEGFWVELTNPVGGGSPTGWGWHILYSAGFGFITDTESAGLEIGIGTQRIVEHDGTKTNTAKVLVSLSDPAPAPVTVDYATVPVGTTSGVDFKPKTGHLTFQAGQFQKFVTVSVLPDATSEVTEYVGIGLSNPVGAVLGCPSCGTGSVEIGDDDHDLFVWTGGVYAGDPEHRDTFNHFARGADSAVTVTTPLLPLGGYDCAIVSGKDLDPSPEAIPYVKNLLTSYVNGGGRLILVGEDLTGSNVDDDVSELSLAIAPTAGITIDSAPGIHDSASFQTTTNISTHALTTGVSSIHYAGAGSMSVAGNGSVLVRTQSGVPFIAASPANANGGRLIVTSDNDWISDHNDSAYFPNPSAYGNSRLADNLCGV